MSTKLLNNGIQLAVLLFRRAEVMAVMLALGNTFANSVWQSNTQQVKRKASFNSTR